MVFKKDKDNEKRTLDYALGRRGNSLQFDVKEVYRHIRTNIGFSNIANTIQVINLTSTQPGEGKTTTAINLAIAYAGIYENVLLIDCDLRKPQIHKYFKLSNKTGLSNYVLDYSTTREFKLPDIKKITDSSFKGALSILPAGIHVPNPGELIESDNFKKFIEHLKKYYDFIVIDCPPIGAVADAIPLSNLSDGTIFVCSSQDTDKRAAKAAIENLKRSNVNILGTVLTKVEPDHSGRYGYYSYDYYGK